ncbi:MAG: hypothetical protein LBL24_10545 [Bacteroidales bacterium]|jgi:hypothetical protein|nr:hypothetical protein [Bacteroidales bacterium]
MKTVIQVILIVAIFAVAYFVYESIQQPLRFNAEQKQRYAATIQRLKDIRSAEVAYRSEYKRYTGSFDTLIDYLKTGTFKVVMQIGDEDDSAAVSGGKIIRDTIRISVLDSLFKKGYPVDSIRYVPFTQGVEFELGTANLEAGKVNVNVFEAKISSDLLLEGLDPQLLVNFNNAEKQRTGYAGLKVGSLEETTNNAGNWE